MSFLGCRKLRDKQAMINLIFRSYYILFHLELTLMICAIVDILPSLFQFYYPKVGFHLLILYIRVNKGKFSKIYGNLGMGFLVGYTHPEKSIYIV